MHSQKLSTSSEVKKYITAKERDSIFNKIQRGKTDALKVTALKKALTECGNTKVVYNKIIAVHEMKADSLSLIIFKQKEIEENLLEINRIQLIEQNKKSIGTFLRGSVLGIILTSIALGILVN